MKQQRLISQGEWTTLGLRGRNRFWQETLRIKTSLVTSQERKTARINNQQSIIWRMYSHHQLFLLNPHDQGDNPSHLHTFNDSGMAKERRKESTGMAGR